MAFIQLAKRRHAVERQLCVRLTDEKEERGFASGAFLKVDDVHAGQSSSGEKAIVLVCKVIRNGRTERPEFVLPYRAGRNHPIHDHV